jgi:3-oxoacyl-[acyl-carrier-protein] synthase-3
MTAVGILGLGTFLPPTVRGNDWWPAAQVARWGERMAHRATRAADDAALAPAAQRTLAALARYVDDPFRGAVTRRVMTPPMTTTDMEAAAAEQALAAAAVDRSAIDAVLTQTPVPERLMVNEASPLHHRLGLARRCLAFGTEAACNGFAVHAELAHALIASGQARTVLSVHSSAITRVHTDEEPHSAWWGDGAAAVVWGPVSAGRGLLAREHYVDGGTCDALVLGVPGQAWWEPGPVTTHSVDRDHTRQMLLSLVERAGDTIAAALRQAGLTADQVGFFAAHQGTAWLADACREQAGLTAAATVVTFPETANMNSVNIPYVLDRGVRAGALTDGTAVVTFGGGLGETWSATVLRWGR